MTKSLVDTKELHRTLVREQNQEILRLLREIAGHLRDFMAPLPEPEDGAKEDAKERAWSAVSDAAADAAGFGPPVRPPWWECGCLSCQHLRAVDYALGKVAGA